MVSKSSCWSTLPCKILQQTRQYLLRDDVIRVARVWPYTADRRLQTFVPGGVPICAKCKHRVWENSADIFSEYTEPTCTFDEVGEDKDSFGAYCVLKDLLTLLSRNILDTAAQKPSLLMVDCFLCEYQTQYTQLLMSLTWQDLLHRYIQSLAERLIRLHKTTCGEDGRLMADSYEVAAQTFPDVCQRCGVEQCNASENCEWYVGEAHVHKLLKSEVIRQRESCMKDGTCTCIHARTKRHVCFLCPNKASSCGLCGLCCVSPDCTAKHRRKCVPRVYSRPASVTCACQLCNAAPSEFCQFCQYCAAGCRQVTCHHHGGPIKTSISHQFVTVEESESSCS